MKIIKIILLIILIISFPVQLFSQQSILLSGSVMKNSNKPAAGYRVYLIDDNNNWIGPALTDRKGYFVFFDIAKGNYKLVIYQVKSNNEEIIKWKGRVSVPAKLNPIKIN